MTETYLRELARLLRVGALRRKRILAEVRAHLDEAGGDADALRRFGTPEEVAARFNELERRRAPRLAALLVLGGALVVFAAVQGLEDFIPAAPWPSADAAPGALDALFTAATVAILTAVASAALALVAPRGGRTPLAGLSCIALLSCIGLLTAYGVERAGYVAGSPSPLLVVALGCACALPPLAATALLAGRLRETASARSRS